MTITDMRKPNSTKLIELENGDLFYLPDKPSEIYMKIEFNIHDVLTYNLTDQTTWRLNTDTEIRPLDGELIINYKGASPYGDC